MAGHETKGLNAPDEVGDPGVAERQISTDRHRDEGRTHGQIELGRSGVAACVALGTLIGWVAWPLGSNRPWSLAILEFSVAGIVGLLSLRAALGRGSPELRQRGARVAVAALIGWVGMAAFALVPWPTAWLASVNPHVAELQSVRPGIYQAAPLSIDVGSTLALVLKYASYVGVFWLTLVLACTRRRVIALAFAVLAVCTAQGAYGTIVQLAGDGADLWNPGFANGYASGTYVGRNHYAGLLVLGLGLATGLVLSGTSAARSYGLRGAVETVVNFLMGPGAWLAFALACMAAGLILSGSRGAFGAWLLAAFSAVLWQRGWTRRARPSVLVAAVVLAAAVWVGPHNLVSRVSELGFDSNRPALVSSTVDLIGQSYWLGAGAGSFEWRFPAVRGAEFGAFYYQHAHNDWLEMVADLGVLGAVPLYVGIGIALARSIGGARRRHDRLARGIATGSAIGAIAFLCHGLVDFNFQIPANGFYFFVLLGLGLNAADRGCMPAALDSPERRYDRARYGDEARAADLHAEAVPSRAGVVSHLEDRRNRPDPAEPSGTIRRTGKPASERPGD
ncbi:MAG: O-antigen ligase family protein [Pseudomonadota bacterium]